MLMDILMEALMSMDDESLDYVLESCDAEELEIISDAMEARFEDGPTKQASGITAVHARRNIGANMISRGDFSTHKDARRFYEEDRDEFNDSLKTINSDRRASKQQGKENARAIRMANLKSKLTTGEPLGKSEKQRILSEAKERPAYRDANDHLDFSITPNGTNFTESLAYSKSREMKKARALRGGVSEYLKGKKK